MWSRRLLTFQFIVRMIISWKSVRLLCQKSKPWSSRPRKSGTTCSTSATPSAETRPSFSSSLVFNVSDGRNWPKRCAVMPRKIPSAKSKQDATGTSYVIEGAIQTPLGRRPKIRTVPLRRKDKDCLRKRLCYLTRPFAGAGNQPWAGGKRFFSASCRCGPVAQKRNAGGPQ